MTNKFKILCFLLSITLNYNFSLLAQTNLTSSNSINFDYYLNLAEQYRDSIGNKNNGFQGGFLFIDYQTSKKQLVLIETSIFKENISGNGGIAFFSNKIL